MRTTFDIKRVRAGYYAGTVATPWQVWQVRICKGKTGWNLTVELDHGTWTERLRETGLPTLAIAKSLATASAVGWGARKVVE